MDRLAEQVAAEQELLRRLEITKETVIEVLAGGDDDGEVGVVVDPEAGVGAAALGWQGRFWSWARMGMGAGCRWPPGTWWRCWPMPARCAPGRCARRWGPALSPGCGRGCGSSPERLVERGWLVETEPGLFACAGGVAAALNGAD
jgi:hypothetical protein